ncbi:hypothetical protein [Streptomyces sp. NPDC091217]|uniref:hypothetical protein n=1 Tax=Streptomyces sp. NPDC091217 TaxID=3365975 RepID=UPI003825321D
MADSQSNAPVRADAGLPTSGVIHVRTRLTADFTVISNALAQRPGSAVTGGVAMYIHSLPDGSPVSIAALCEHFTEGEILISRALRELEDAGYLRRRRERTPTGQIRTRTYFYDVPGGNPGPEPETGPGLEPESGPEPGPGAGAEPKSGPGPESESGPGPEPAPEPEPEPEPESEPEPDPDGPPKPRRPRMSPSATVVAPAPAPAAVPETVQAHAPARAEAPNPLADADPKAIAVLATLRRIDPRLVLSEQEAVRLAPAVTRWLAAGLLPTQITDHLTARLPDSLLTRPAGILAYRLKETPLPTPARSTEPPAGPVTVPMRNCDGCDRGFRSAQPGRCRDCRSGESGNRLRAAC